MSFTWNEMTAQEIADACETAADILEGNWIQGHWWEPTRQAYCMEGGMAAALNLDVIHLADDAEERRRLTSCPVYRAVMDTVIERIKATEDEVDIDPFIQEVEDDGLPWWNDRNERDEQEVLDVLHTTAKRVLGVAPDHA